MKFVLAVIVVVVLALATFETTMQPSASETVQLLAIFVSVAVAAVAGSWLLRRWAQRSHSLQQTVVAASAAALILVGLAVGVSAGMMFLSSHDLNLLLVTLGFGLAMAVVFAVAVSRPLVADLRKVGDAAARVADGDLEARTGIDRPDELGDAARAFDDMIDRLDQVEGERLAEDEARRAFLAAIGHDLRTPLAALQAAVEALADGVAPDPERYLRSMQADLGVMSHLVDDLFLLARIEAGQFEFERVPVDIAELADEAIDALDPVAQRRNVSLRLVTDGMVPTVGGPEAIGRVIRNLVDNAIRYAPASSEVVVAVSNGDGALVSVEDDGPGFPPEFVEAAFESFVRADPARTRTSGGAGLGLAIAHGVVAAHGGTIWAEAGPGGRVAFRLPAA